MGKDGKHRITLRAIEVFVSVVEEGSLATGARRLGASPSAVSQQISNLEAALGAKLIDRAARPLILTPAGNIFQKRALMIMDAAVRAQSELAELELTSLPQLRLAFIGDFDANVTPELSFRLSSALPDCNIICHAGQSHENIAALEARREDIVVATDIGKPADWIEQHPLVREPFVLITARNLIRDREDPVSQLLAAPMVRYPASQIISQQIENHLRRLRLAPRRRFEFDSNASVMAMVAKSGGWAITTPLAYFSARRFREALDLRPLPFKGFARSLSLYARRGVLGDLPMRVAGHLRSLIAEHPIAQAEREAPWLAGEIRLLDETVGSLGRTMPE